MLRVRDVSFAAMTSLFALRPTKDPRPKMVAFLLIYAAYESHGSRGGVIIVPFCDPRETLVSRREQKRGEMTLRRKGRWAV